MPLLLEYGAGGHTSRIASISIQQVVEVIKQSGRHLDKRFRASTDCPVFSGSTDIVIWIVDELLHSTSCGCEVAVLLLVPIEMSLQRKQVRCQRTFRHRNLS